MWSTMTNFSTTRVANCINRVINKSSSIRRFYSARSTIFALSTAQGKAGLAVIRVSGPAAFETLQKLTNRPRFTPSPRVATLCKLIDPESKEALDEALVLSFAGPSSFTGEDVVEYHVHGSRAVVSGVLSALSKSSGQCRPAEAGEFTERAFQNNRMDLLQVEALSDLLASETQAQRQQALLQLSGSSGEFYNTIREQLITCLAHTEALIDFGEDESDVSNDTLDHVTRDVEKLAETIRSHLDDGKRGELIRDGIRVALIAEPNAGKSSLLNLLAKRDAAIVSTTAGTTRDVLSVPIDIGGFEMVFSDTAGIRDTKDEIELEGISRAQRVASESDIRVVLVDADKALRDGVSPLLSSLVPKNGATILLLNKSDLLRSNADVEELCETLLKQLEQNPPLDIIPISCTENRISLFTEKLTEIVSQRLKGGDENESSGPQECVITRERHRSNLEECLAHLESYAVPGPSEIELKAEELRCAVQSLGRIVGRVDVETILDKLFYDFCIGK